jgi:G3E family GTPase
MAELSSAPPVAAPAIPVLVFTGFLGAGKTTIILNLIRQIPHLKSAWLKNGTSQHRCHALLIPALVCRVARDCSQKIAENRP